MPFSIFRTKTVTAANIAGLILGTVTFSMFLMLTLYMQQVLTYSPMRTGVAYRGRGHRDRLVGVAAQLVNRGVKPIIALGMTLLIGRPLLHAGLGRRTYAGDLLPGFLIIAAGLGFSFVPISIAALAGVQSSEVCLRAVQHLAADRRRARHRALDIATTKTSDGVAGAAQGAHRRLRGRVHLGRHRRCDRNRRRARARPARGPRAAGRGGSPRAVFEAAQVSG